MRKIYALGGAILIAAAVIATTVLVPMMTSSPASLAQRQGEVTYTYPVKFVCGSVAERGDDLPAASEPPVKPGNYATAVNIQNLSNEEVPISYWVSVAYSLPAEKKSVSDTQNAVLPPRGALEIDCPQIVGAFDVLGADNPFKKEEFLKGFVVLQSKTEIEVAAVYTSQRVIEITSGGVVTYGGTGTSIDVEYIEPRIQREQPTGGRPDLGIEKEQEGVFQQGQMGHYLITVTNNGTGTASPPITVVDTLPAGFTFQSGSSPWTCQVTGQVGNQEVVTCTYPGSIAPGDSVTLTLEVEVHTIAAEPPGDNCVVVKHPDDANPGNNEVCVETEVEW